METLTKVATSSITNTKLAIATLAALMAGGAALATVPLTKTVDIAVKEVNVGLENLTEFIPVNVSYDNRGNTRLADIYCMRLDVKDNAGTVVNLTTTNVSASSGFNVTAATDGAVCVTKAGPTTYIDPGKKVSVSLKIRIPTLVQILPARLTVKVDGGNLLKEKNFTGDAETNNEVKVNLPTTYSCTETDSGNDLTRAGTITETDNLRGTRYTNNDTCLPNGYIIEYYCLNNRVTTASTTCPTGYGCRAGACAALPDLTFSTSTGLMPVVVDLSGVGSVKINYYNDSLAVAPAVTSGVKISWLNRLGTVLTPAVNPQTSATLNGHTFGTAIFPLPTDYNVRNIKVDLDPNNTLTEGNENNNTYTSMFPCTETDNRLDFFTKGKIAGNNGWNSEEYRHLTFASDICSGPLYLSEYFCSSNYVTVTSTNCSGGCMDGACVPGNFSCTEADGGNNPYVAATTTVTNGNGTWSESWRDRCSGVNMLMEYSCFGNNTTTVNYVNCPNGCADGACLATSTPTTTLSLILNRGNNVASRLITGENTLGEILFTTDQNNYTDIQVDNITVGVNYNNVQADNWKLTFPVSGETSWNGSFGNDGKLHFSAGAGNSMVMTAGRTYTALVKAFMYVSSTPPGSVSIRSTLEGVSSAPSDANIFGLPLNLGVISN